MSSSYNAKTKGSRQLVVAGLIALALFDAAFWLLAVEPAATRTADREAAVAALESQVQQKRESVAKLRESSQRVAAAGDSGAELLEELTFARENAFSELLTELGEAATAAGVEMRETDYAAEAIAGNESYGMVSVTANFRGRYENLVRLLNRLDRSSDFLIVESLGARPREDTGDLQISMRIDTFVKEL